MLGAYIFTIVMSSSWTDPLIIMYCPSLSLVIFILRSILSHMRIATPAFFCFPFAWNIFFHPLTFSLYVSLGLKWVSCRQHTYGSCFCIHSVSLCLLVGAFNPFTFKVIIEVVSLYEFSLFDTPQGQFSSSGTLRSPWGQCSHSKGSGLDLWQEPPPQGLQEPTLMVTRSQTLIPPACLSAHVKLTDHPGPSHCALALACPRFIILTTLKCTVCWHQVHSHCCEIITIMHLQNFFIIPN